MTDVTPSRVREFPDWIEAMHNAEDFLARCAEGFVPEDSLIHAFVDEPGRFERLRQQASELPHGPLRGLLVGVKDIFHVDGLPTHAGSRLPADSLAGPEAEAVTELKTAGALILGKTVSTEFAYFSPGPTRNPHNLEHTPGGSSSGSAAAVAAGLCPLALGTQTIGSISRPAAFCGVVGFKPSYGRIPTHGVIPLAPSLDHVGTFTASIADARRAAEILCTHWQPSALPEQPVLGVPIGPYMDRPGEEAKRHFVAACRRLEMAGFELRRTRLFTDLDVIESRHRLILAAEAARVHESWYSSFGDLYQPATRDLVELGRQISDGELSAALPGRRQLRQRIATVAAYNGIDVWVTPAACGPAPLGLASTGDPIMSLPWTHAGLPTITLPSSFSDSGLPLAIQLAAGWQRDENLLVWAESIASHLREEF